jgi:Zn-dependent protease with chaperone function
VNVLAYGSPVTIRYLAFIAALLSAGIFVGSWWFNQTQGLHWVDVVVTCAAQAKQPSISLTPVQAELAREALEAGCRGAVELRRAAYGLGGAGVVAAAALVIVYVAPVMVRRRRRLRRLGSGLREARGRFAELAAEAGLRHLPDLERGPASQRDAFSYGAPGRPRVVLPPAVAVRWRDRDVFDPVVRHELAHVRQHDVALAWLARSAWYALAPLLFLPAAVSLLSGDNSILADLIWRAALLGLTVLLASAALLRSREHDADLRAIQSAGEASSLAALLRRSAGGPARNRRRRLVARHPTPDQRIMVLRQPDRAASVTFVDGFSSAFLAGLLIPLVSMPMIGIFTSAGRPDLGDWVATLVAGLMLGGMVGLGLRRTAVAERIAGSSGHVAPAALGVAAGLVLGQLSSLAGTGSGVTGGLYLPAWLVVSAALGAGATALSAGLAELGADAVLRVNRRLALTATVVIDGLIFAAALWIANRLQFFLDSGGLAFARAQLVTSLSSELPQAGLIIGTVAVLALSAGWALWARADRMTPLARMTEDGTWPARPSGHIHARQWVPAVLACGITAEGSLAALHFIEPATSSSIHAQRYYLYMWVAASAGGTCTLVLWWLDRARGVGLACLAAPLATLTAVTGFLVVNTALGGSLSVSFVLTVTQAPLVLGLLLCLAAALAVLVPQARLSTQPAAPASTRQARPLLTFVTAAACGVTVPTLLVIGRGTLVGPPTTLISANSDSSSVFTAAALDGLRYLNTTVPAIETAIAPAQRSIASASAAATSGLQAAILQAETLPLLRKSLRYAESVRPGTPQLAEIHRHCVTALQDSITEYTLFAQALREGNASVFDQARIEQRAASAEWSQWQVGLLELRLGGGIAVIP